MKSYRYELIVYKKAYDEEWGNIGIKLKRFIGNNQAELLERFEMWFIKQSLTREEIYIYQGEIQHAGY